MHSICSHIRDLINFGTVMKKIKNAIKILALNSYSNGYYDLVHWQNDYNISEYVYESSSSIYGT